VSRRLLVVLPASPTRPPPLLVVDAKDTDPPSVVLAVVVSIDANEVAGVPVELKPVAEVERSTDMDASSPDADEVAVPLSVSATPPLLVLDSSSVADLVVALSSVAVDVAAARDAPADAEAARHRALRRRA
jgi:hypothetical protein